MIDVPLFSLLIAAYNSEDTIAETLDSVLAQTDARWEAIVVDDGSVDRTYEIASGYAASDARIRVIREGDVGAALSRNAAAAMARGPWLCALDGDDMLVPEALQRQSAFIAQNPGFLVYSWGAWKLFPDGSRVPFDDTEEYRSVVSFGVDDLIDHNRILANTVVDASTFDAVGGFRDYMLEDYDLWLRILHSGAHHLHNPELLAVYRMREMSKSTHSHRMMAGTAEVLEDFAATPGLSPEQVDSASARARYWRAWAARTQLEECLAEGRYGQARALLPGARSTFPATLKSYVGLSVLWLLPSAYARYKGLAASRGPESADRGNS
ncbi:MAG: glycosyltransferase [Coriobacteriia bacterium]|nr:glycosyltransferase [Coriobacteriia bacterium]